MMIIIFTEYYSEIFLITIIPSIKLEKALELFGEINK